MPSQSLESRIPGARWFHGLRNPVVRTGILIGIYLSVVMVAAVLLANYVPWLEAYANERNWAARGVFGLLALVPVAVYRRSAQHLFAAGMLAWAVATVTYVVLGFFFENLYTRLRTPGEFFMLGAVGYGVAAILRWVADMVLAAREHHRGSGAAARRHSS